MLKKKNQFLVEVYFLKIQFRNIETVRKRILTELIFVRMVRPSVNNMINIDQLTILISFAEKKY